MKKQKKNKSKRASIKLSIVILNYNTKDLLVECLKSLDKVKDEINFEVIVVDNNSKDGSVDVVKEKFSWVKLIINKDNLGFAAGNNVVKDHVTGDYILFLNSDTVVEKGTLKETVKFMDKNKEVGALTSKLVLPSGELDKDVRRSFPTPWVSLTHLVLPLDRLFPNSKVFAKYWYSYIPDSEVHEVDVLQGAFFLTRKKVLDEVGWFDEDYFLDGEDIDLSWKIKNAGWKIIYYPKVETIHVKGASKGKNRIHKKRVSLKEKMKYRMAGVNSMELFYKKRLWDNYPFFVNYPVLFGIKLLKFVRLTKLIFLG